MAATDGESGYDDAAAAVGASRSRDRRTGSPGGGADAKAGVKHGRNRAAGGPKVVKSLGRDDPGNMTNPGMVWYNDGSIGVFAGLRFNTAEHGRAPVLRRSCDAETALRASR